MKYRKGMRFLSLEHVLGSRSMNKVYTIIKDHDDYFWYNGDDGDQKRGSRSYSIKLLSNDNLSEVDMLDAIKYNIENDL